MIGFRDTFTLALTKLRTRKVRLGVTIVISGLLFTGLAAASIIARGTFASIEEFSTEGFGKRFIINGYPQSASMYTIYQDESIMARATQIHKEIVAKKKVEAKRLGIMYDATTDPAPVQEFDTGNGTKQRSLDFMHPAAVQAVEEYVKANPGPGMDELKKTAEAYGPTKFYESTARSFSSDGSSLQVLENGKESYAQQSVEMSGPPSGLDSFVHSWQSMSSGLLEPFLLPGQNLNESDDGAVPMVIPVDAAEKLLGLTALPSNAKPDEKLERIKEIRSKAGDLRFEVCYRNSTSAALIGSAVATQQEIDRNKNNKDFIKPELIYGLPTEPCGSSPVVRDVRSAATKRQEAKQEEFDRIFGKQPASQTKLKFRVVGVVPAFDFGAAVSVTQIITSLLTSSLGTGWFTPTEYLDADPNLNSIFAGQTATAMNGTSYYAEFTNASSARSFMDEQNCQPDFGAGDPSLAIQGCEDEGKFFSLMSFGSNSLGLESAKRNFGKIFKFAAIGVAVIAAIIMMGTVGRMIADSRRETAVFRAIGAKRIDIAQIYVLYTLLLSILICLFAITAGSIIAGWLHGRYSEGITVEALVAYNAQDLERIFRLYNFYLPDMLYLIGLTLAAGLISSFLPLFRNLRRNPIRDMRDDT